MIGYLCLMINFCYPKLFQVDYHEHSSGSLQKKPSFRKQSADVFVATKRTIFTPASNDLATPTFLRTECSSHTDNINKIKSSEAVSEISQTNFKSSESIPIIEVTDAVEAESGYSRFTDSSCKEDFFSLPRKLSKPVRPLVTSCGSPSSSVVESKKKILKAANKSPGDASPSVRGLIDEYNKRITERQSLLSSPSKCWNYESPTSSNIRLESVLKSNSTPVVPSFYPITATTRLPGRCDDGMLTAPSSASVDTSFDTSTDELNVAGTSRAFKMKQVKEDFFSKKYNRRETNNKNYSNTSTTTNSLDSLAFTPSATPTFDSKNMVATTEVTADRPPTTGSRKDGSIKGESTGCITAGTVSKSASSPQVDLRQAHPIRPSSTDPGLHPGKHSKGIFKLFRRAKDKEGRDMKTVRKLVRHSLEVNIEPLDRSKNKRASASSVNYPSTSKMREESDEESSRSTLPRQGDGPVGMGASTRSCPSSPVAYHKKRASHWLAKGKTLFKGRSPSPGAKSYK